MTQATALRVQAFATGDVAAQCSATPGWVQQYQQMSPGHFAGQVRYLDLHGVQVYEECMNTRVEQHFNAPAGALAFCFDGSDKGLGVHCCCALEPIRWELPACISPTPS